MRSALFFYKWGKKRVKENKADLIASVLVFSLELFGF